MYSNSYRRSSPYGKYGGVPKKKTSPKKKSKSPKKKSKSPRKPNLTTLGLRNCKTLLDKDYSVRRRKGSKSPKRQATGKLNQYAQFVKANFQRVRQDLGGAASKDVMRALGAEWQARKLGI